MSLGLYEWAWHRWYKRAKKRAMKDPVYAAEELGRSSGSFFIASGAGNDGTEYTLDGMWGHMKRFDELCPNPWWVKVHHFRDRHRLRFKMKYNDIKWFIQRGRRGYSDQDLWSFDSYLSEVISSALLDLRDKAHGYPGDMCEACMQPYEEHDCNGFEKWQGILTEISEGFAMDKFAPENWMNDKFDRAMALFVKYFHNLWD